MGRPFLIFLLLAGCRNIPSKSPEEATEGSKSQPRRAGEDADPFDECAAQRRSAEQDFVRGHQMMEDARVGEHYRAKEMGDALDLLEDAGRRGSVRAHSLFGRRQFEFLFLNEAPQPAERDLYVRALSSLIIAARREDPDAVDYLPGLAELRVEGGQLLPTELPEPLSDFDRAWLIEAVERADAWSSCAPEVEWV